ncbi:DUF4861 domain-containing protein [Paludibacter sp.]
MKYYILLLFTATLFSCSSTLKLSVENNLDFDRSEEMVELDVNRLAKKISTLKADETYIVSCENEVIPSQITSDGKLIFQSHLGASQKKTYEIKIDKVLTYNPKVFGRVFNERKEDFAWENDKVGFRLYGNELKAFDGPSNGLDLWYKRTDKLVLNEWYRKSVEERISYHVDHGEGCDPYGVGHSLGAGAMAPYIDEKLILNDNYLKATILDNGPLRFSARLDYPDLEINGRLIAESRTVTLDAGSQFTKIIQYYKVPESMQVAAGIVKRQTNDSVLWNVSDNFFLYKEPETQENGQIFLAVIMPDGLTKVKVDTYEYFHPVAKKNLTFSHVIGVADYNTQKPLTYYTGFGWTKSGFMTVEDFQNYTKKYYQAVKQPFIIKFK